VSTGAPTLPGLFDGASEILAPLNEEQQAAVTHGEGPLLIVAGAGTGKTAVVTRRIAWLIATKRARPGEILALTFTEKAAAEMESRVDELVPYGYVGATISTFHAFCDAMLREHAIELGLTTRLRVDTPAEIAVFVREHIFELGLRRYLPLGRPETHLRALLWLFDAARDEDVSPEDYAAFARSLAEEAGDDPVKRDRAEREVEKAGAYERFQLLLHRHGRVDFGSQISLAVRLLRERPYLQREYRDRFRYILVDEFQDTNHVQFELVKLLTGERRNVTVVGDDDQSIYRFRGAKVENLLGFLDAFPGARVAVLNRNYRSGQQILDIAYRLIQHNNPQRLEAMRSFDKRLVADRPIEAEVEHVHVRNASDEADLVASQIAESVRSGARAPRDFAVLARSHASLDPFAQALRVNGVPFRRVGVRGLYSRPEVQLCLNVLRTLADPEDDTAAHFVLHDPFFGAHSEDVARLGAAAHRSKRPLLQLARNALTTASDTLNPASRDAFERVLGLLDRLHRAAGQRPTTEVLYAFMTESGLLSAYSADGGVEAEESIQNLSKLLGIVQRVAPLLQSDRVAAFIRHLDLLIEMGDDPAAAEVDFDEDAVNLLTAHNAKGLEFPVVYLVQMVEGRFPLRHRQDAMPFPEELRKAFPETADSHDREERRLAYVGMTRARDRLVLCHADDYGGQRAFKPSRFVMEALLLPTLPKGPRAATALQAIARHAPPAQSPPVEIEPLAPDEPLRLSHNQVETYKECPLRYRYAHVLHVPTGGDPASMFGIAVHHALRIYQQHRIKGLPISADAVVTALEGAWSSEGFLSREHEDWRLEEGRRLLREFVAREERGKPPLAVEREFRFRLGPTTVTGRWDRIDERPEGIVLVDYKTSEVEDAEEAEKRAKDDVRGGQLGLYALAYREMHGVVPAAVEMHFVVPGLVGRAEVMPDHLQRAEDRVLDAASGIRARAFPSKPSAQRCGNCPYARVCPDSAARGAG
jgi:DNA helicase-2/ATP-dependent DNA helicase PcrA